MKDEVTLQAKVQGAAKASAELGAVAAAEERVALATDATGLSLKRTTSHGWLFNQMMFTLRRVAYAGTLGLAAVTTAAVIMGVQFNATMEQNQVAFTHFLGSTQESQKELLFLYDLAAHTPFEFPQLTDAARKFLAFGFSVGETNKDLKVIGDTISGLGLGSEAIDRLVLAIGQIRAKGRVMGEELLQITELGIPAYSILQEQLGLTGKQIGRIGELGIPANVAIEALMRGMTSRFKGAAEEQAKTFTGQASTLRDNVRQMVGAGTEPLFFWLRDKVLPLLNDTATAATAAFKSGGWEAAIVAIDQHLDLGGSLITVWDHLVLDAKNLRDIMVMGVAPGFIDAWKSMRETLLFSEGLSAGLGVLAHNADLVSSAVQILIYYLVLSRTWLLAEAIATGINTRAKMWSVRWTKLNVLALKSYILWTRIAAATTAIFTVLLDLATAGAIALTVALLGISLPVAIIIAAVVVLVGILFVLYFRWKAFRDIVNETFTWIKDHWQWVLLPFAPLTAAILLVVTHAQSLWDWVVRIWDFLHNRLFILKFSVEAPDIPGFDVFGKDSVFKKIGIPDIPNPFGGISVPRPRAAAATGAVNAPLTLSEIKRPTTLTVESPVFIGRREVARAVNEFNADDEARK